MSFLRNTHTLKLVLVSVVAFLLAACSKDDLIEKQNKQIAEQSTLIENKDETIRAQNVKIEVFTEQTKTQQDHLSLLLKKTGDKNIEFGKLKKEVAEKDEVMADQAKRLLTSEDQLQAHILTSMGKIVVRLFEDKTPKTVANFVDLATGAKPIPTDGEAPKPFYDGLTFHRIINDFMIQGGCPLGNGMGGPGYTFEDECYTDGELLSGEISDLVVAEQIFTDLIVPHLREYNGQSPIPMIKELYQEMRTKRSYQPLIGKTIEEISAALEVVKPIHKKVLIDEVRYGTLCMANSGPNTNGSQFFIVTKKEGCSWLNGKHTVFGEVVEGFDVLDKIQSVETGPNDAPVTPVKILKIDIAKVTHCVEFLERAPTPASSPVEEVATPDEVNKENETLEKQVDPVSKEQG